MPKGEEKKQKTYETLKNIFQKEKSYPELTPEKENEIRVNEREEFARSFKFQSLFSEEEPNTNILGWLSLGFSILIIIIIIWRT